MQPADVRKHLRHIYLALDPRLSLDDDDGVDLAIAEMAITPDREDAQSWADNGWIVFEYGIVDWLKPKDTND